MSRQNKVNPGMYTQRGRLTQDDAARELAKQRSLGSQHTWQPVQRDAKPRLNSDAAGADDDAADAVRDESTQEKPARVMARAKPVAIARKEAKAKAPRLVRRSVKREGGTARKAVLARGAGKGSALLATGRKKKKAAAPAKRKR